MPDRPLQLPWWGGRWGQHHRHVPRPLAAAEAAARAAADGCSTGAPGRQAVAAGRAAAPAATANRVASAGTQQQQLPG